MKVSFLIIIFNFLLSFCMNLGDQNIASVDANSIPNSISFSNHVWPILVSHCIDCHSTTGKYGTSEGIAYDSHADVVAIDPDPDGDLGFNGIRKTGIIEKTMPPGSKERFSPLDIEILLKWELQGKLNN